MTFALFVVPVVLLLVGFPIFMVLLTAVTVALVFFMHVPLIVVHQNLFGSVNATPLLAVPFFIYAGELMGRGSVAQRLVDFVQGGVGSVRGSLGVTTVGTSAIFGAISGVSAATVATIGKVMVPAMRRAGYPEAFTAGLISGIEAFWHPQTNAIQSSARPRQNKLFTGEILAAAAMEFLEMIAEDQAGFHPGIAFILGQLNQRSQGGEEVTDFGRNVGPDKEPRGHRFGPIWPFDFVDCFNTHIQLRSYLITHCEVLPKFSGPLIQMRAFKLGFQGGVIGNNEWADILLQKNL